MKQPPERAAERSSRPKAKCRSNHDRKPNVPAEPQSISEWTGCIETAIFMLDPLELLGVAGLSDDCSRRLKILKWSGTVVALDRTEQNSRSDPETGRNRTGTLARIGTPRSSPCTRSSRSSYYPPLWLPSLSCPGRLKRGQLTVSTRDFCHPLNTLWARSPQPDARLQTHNSYTIYCPPRIPAPF